MAGISIPSIPSVSFPGFTAPTLPPVLAATPTLPGGLPSIPGGLPAPPAAVSLDTVTVTAQKQPEGWGIYLQNDKVISPDSIVSLEYRREWRIAAGLGVWGRFAGHHANIYRARPNRKGLTAAPNRRI